MKLNIDKYESELLQLIKAHTGCESRMAIALLADLKHLESGKPEKMKFSVIKNTSEPTQRKRGFL